MIWEASSVARNVARWQASNVSLPECMCRRWEASSVARSAARWQASYVSLYLNVCVGDGRLIVAPRRGFVSQLQEAPLGGRQVMFFST
jgi:hypothetical protein